MSPINALINSFILMSNGDLTVQVDVLYLTQEQLIEAAEIVELPKDDYWQFDGIKKGEVTHFTFERNNSGITFSVTTNKQPK
jgi:hypothetical protein